MNYLDNFLFMLLLVFGIGFFIKNARKLIRNIKLGKATNRFDQPKKRLKNMILLAFGQRKIISKPMIGILHLVLYIGFFFINIELLEIIVDGISGTHRVFSFLGKPYNFLIATSEVLALLIIITVFILLARRLIVKVKRLQPPDIKGFSKKDALYVLFFELALMMLFLFMNAADASLQQFKEILDNPYIVAGSFPISKVLHPIFEGFSYQNLVIMERTFWWLHITGILLFLNYLFYSKHLHILIAFPNTYFAKLTPLGKFSTPESVTKEVNLFLNPAADFNSNAADESQEITTTFGAKDVMDLNWAQLMNAYTCTECGRCSEVCPANITGKELSPRTIMMKTRDRLEEVGQNIDKNGCFKNDGKQLLNDYITPTELWACTTCNACVEACPIDIDPMSIILEMRRYLIMEKSEAPGGVNTMMTHVENNGAPWQFNQMDRTNWISEIE
jgi:heterodisulfide reductase subunit C